MSTLIRKPGHADGHGLNDAHWDWLRSHPAITSSTGFFIGVLDMPDHLDSLPDSLHLNVPESECRYEIRGNRKCASRVCDRKPVPARRVCVIMSAPDVNSDSFLYTAYGTNRVSIAPKEPGDRSIESWEEQLKSRKFWYDAALSAE